jgi:hypothetical protein
VLDAERLPRHARRDDVRVVAAGDRREGPGALDARLDQDIAVETVADDLLAVEVAAQPAELLRVLVDHGHLVVEPLEGPGQGGSHPATSHDHHVHDMPPQANSAQNLPSISPSR